MLMPLLSEADPKVSAEGSIDPLGMYAIADALAVRMIPGVRERQQHPRFLTHIAISLSLAAEFEGRIATDDISEPWQVFEWYVVEGLVRSTKDPKQLRGLPGQEKVAKARQDKVPLSAKRYLKTPTVFGFHGIYRALARDVNVERADRLGNVGDELATTWATEQGLAGFFGTSGGSGRSTRQMLLDAIEDGLKKGAVARKDGWSGWDFFSKHLGIYGIPDSGNKESAVISKALLNPAAGHRKEVLDALLAPKGRELWSAAQDSRERPERKFHELLIPAVSPELLELLRAIDVYETFSRLLQDAFDDCLFEMSVPQRKVRLKELAELRSVESAAAKIPEIFSEVAIRLQPFGKEVAFRESFASLAEHDSKAGWVERLLDHHSRIQHSKPPVGKSPWVDRFDDGSYMVRTGYLRETGGSHDDSYVHAYRTQSLWSFARDIRMVK